MSSVKVLCLFLAPLLRNMCSYCTLACKVKRRQSEEGLGAGGLDGSECERWRFQFVTGHRYRTSWRLCRGCSCRRSLLYFSNGPVAGCATVNCKHMWAATYLQLQMYFQWHCQIILSRFCIFYESMFMAYVLNLLYIIYAIQTLHSCSLENLDFPVALFIETM